MSTSANREGSSTQPARLTPPRTINVRVTTLNHRDDSFGRTAGSMWNSTVRDAFREANRILSPFGLAVVMTNRSDMAVVPSRRYLTADIRQQARRGNLDYSWCQRMRHEAGVASYYGARREGYNLPHLLSREYFVDIAEVVATVRTPIGVASSEALRILALNRAPGEIATYWVPGLEDPNSSGHSLCQPIYSNVPRNREGIFMAPHAPADTLAHEIVHILTRAGHCSFSGPNGTYEGSAGPDNLMHHDGSARTGHNLTQGQIDRIAAHGTPYL